MTEIISYAARPDLLREQPRTGAIPLGMKTDSLSGNMTNADLQARLMAGQFPTEDDPAVLVLLNDLPTVDREREDILGLRAMLALRLSHHEQAVKLVQIGLIRYPASPVHYNLAGMLFERAAKSSGAPPESLQKIVSSRFSAREYDTNREAVHRFLAGGHALHGTVLSPGKRQ